MLSLACKDMGSTDCSFVATDETMEGLVTKMKAHAAEAHPEKMEEMSASMSEEEMMEMMEKSVKTI